MTDGRGPPTDARDKVASREDTFDLPKLVLSSS
jgi:hypothetical protein